MELDEMFQRWNGVELRSLEGGEITTGYVCELCGAVIYWALMEKHHEWHLKQMGKNA
jgi:hypothetical protein